MKKKIVMVLLAMTMAFSVTACGSTKDVVSTKYEDDDEKDDEDEDDGEEDNKQDLEETKEENDDNENNDDKEDNDTDETEDADDEDNKPASGVVLGSEFDKDYDGFEYIYCETLMTESEENETTGKMESESLLIFIPRADYASVNRDTAYAEDLGVDFRVTLNPYIRYEEEDYLPEENLAYYLESKFNPFYSTDYKDIEISEVENLDKGVKATVRYCYYDRWTESYMPIFCTYYMTELSKDLSVLVEVEINLEDVTGKTDFLLTELETFYEFDIDWDKAEAQKKVDNYLNSPEANVNLVSTGYMMFELPQGWSQDYSYNDYTSNAFAPKGDVEKAGCVVDVYREYMGMESFDMADLMATEEDLEDYKEFMAESLGDDAKNIMAEYYGETPIGNALKFSYTVQDGEYEQIAVVYVITNGDYVYSIEGTALTESNVDINTVMDTVIATAVLDN